MRNITYMSGLIYFRRFHVLDDVKIVAISMSGKCAFRSGWAFLGNNEFIFRETAAIQLLKALLRGGPFYSFRASGPGAL
ncbi:hypothetical protein K5D56_11090 [Pseudomonas cichorii]|nr:hypothetical protein [Pseudomonas cichorii]